MDGKVQKVNLITFNRNQAMKKAFVGLHFEMVWTIHPLNPQSTTDKTNHQLYTELVKL